MLDLDITREANVNSKNPSPSNPENLHMCPLPRPPFSTTRTGLYTLLIKGKAVPMNPVPLLSFTMNNKRGYSQPERTSPALDS